MKSYLHGRKSLAAPALRLPPALAASLQRKCTPTSPTLALEGTANSTVEVVKEGDKVVRLLVTCACGEKIEVDCIYPAGM